MRNEVIKDLLSKGISPVIVFDVGANVGQSLIEFSEAFPLARIHSFEPIQASFEALENCSRRYPNASVHQVALSSAKREVVMLSEGRSLGNRIMGKVAAGRRSQTFTTDTGSGTAARLGVERIDILKIDTEGHDLEVVRGFDQMIRAKQIDYIQVECSFAPENDRHIRFEAFTEHFFALGYRLFGIYGQRRQLADTKTRNLMFGDAVFVAMP